MSSCQDGKETQLSCNAFVPFGQHVNLEVGELSLCVRAH